MTIKHFENALSNSSISTQKTIKSLFQITIIMIIESHQILSTILLKIKSYFSSILNNEFYKNEIHKTNEVEQK